jgi:Uma2 family endonuclease
MSVRPIPKLTFDEYLAIERGADCRSEFIDGQMYAMSGGSRNHAHIIMAAGAQLYAQLRGAPCSVVSSDSRVKTNRMGAYPDLVVTCGPDQVYDKRRDTLTDATVIVEVLSPSTKRFDQGEKFEFYRSLPSFREYLLLWQDSIRAEITSVCLKGAGFCANSQAPHV